MTRTIDESQVRHIAQLARLQLSDEEVRSYSSDLSSILGYMDQLNEVNTDGVEPTAHVLPVCNVLRDDIAQPSPGPDAILNSAPQREGSFFKVPKVLDQGEA